VTVRPLLALAAVAALLLTACSGGPVEPDLLTAERQLTGLLDRTMAAAAPGAKSDVVRREQECQDSELSGTGSWQRSQEREWVMAVTEIDALIDAVAEHWRAEGLEVRVTGEPGDTAVFGEAEDGIRVSVERTRRPDADATEVALLGSTGCHEPVLDPPFDPDEPPPTPLGEQTAAPS
jgi:hypothetical protein